MGRPLSSEPGLRNPNMLDEAPGGRFLGIYIQGEDIGQSDPDAQYHRRCAAISPRMWSMAAKA